CALPALHSFPTRRSSDLPDGTAADWTLHATATLVAEQEAHERVDVPVASDAAIEHDVDDAYDRLARSGYDYGPTFRALRQVAIRSEEHTSELQSRFDLVC